MTDICTADIVVDYGTVWKEFDLGAYGKRLYPCKKQILFKDAMVYDDRDVEKKGRTVKE